MGVFLSSLSTKVFFGTTRLASGFRDTKKRRVEARLRVSGSLVLPDIVFQITQTRFVVVNKRLRVFCIREADDIAILGFVKTDKVRQPCHLRNLDQGVVIILAVVYV